MTAKFRTRARSAITGFFVTMAHALANRATTIIEKIKRKPQ